MVQLNRHHLIFVISGARKAAQEAAQAQEMTFLMLWIHKLNLSKNNRKIKGNMINAVNARMKTIKISVSEDMLIVIKIIYLTLSLKMIDFRF